MASSSSASRSSSARSGCCDAPAAATPMRKSTFASTVRPPASGRRTVSASLNLPALTSAWAPEASGAGEGGLTAACDIGAASRRKAPAARARRKRLIVIVRYSGVCLRKKRGWQNLPPSSRSLDLKDQDLI